MKLQFPYLKSQGQQQNGFDTVELEDDNDEYGFSEWDESDSVEKTIEIEKTRIKWAKIKDVIL